jgi:hypothetical protein
MGEGLDSVAGTLAAVTRDEVILDIYDAFGEYVGIRHAIPWFNVYRIMTFDMEAMTTLQDLIEEEDDSQKIKPPSWVGEVLKAAADAVEEDDDGTI